MSVNIRKLVTVVEEILSDGGRPARRPLRKVAAVAVIENPFAGRFVKISRRSSTPAKSWARCWPRWPPRRSARPRSPSARRPSWAREGSTSTRPRCCIPSSARRSARRWRAARRSSPPRRSWAPGTSIDVPLHFKDAAFVRTHYDAMEVRLHDAPRSGEIVLAIAVTDGGRLHPRVGGLTRDEVSQNDGLR